MGSGCSSAEDAANPFLAAAASAKAIAATAAEEDAVAAAAAAAAAEEEDQNTPTPVWPPTMPSLKVLLDDAASDAQLGSSMAAAVGAVASIASQMGTLPFGVGPLMSTISAVMGMVQQVGMNDGHCKALALDAYEVMEVFYDLWTSNPTAFEQCKRRAFRDSLHMARLNLSLSRAKDVVKEYTEQSGFQQFIFANPWGAKFLAASAALDAQRRKMCEYLVTNFVLTPETKRTLVAVKEEAAAAYVQGRTGANAAVLRKLKAPVPKAPHDNRCMGWVKGGDKPKWCMNRWTGAAGMQLRAVAGSDTDGFYFVCGTHANLDLEVVPKAARFEKV